MSGQDTAANRTGAQGHPVVQAALDLWKNCIKEWYPDRGSRTLFLPPIRFNRVPYGVTTVGGESVMVRLSPSDLPPSGSPPMYPATSSATPLQTPQPVAGRLWTPPPSTPYCVEHVMDSDVRDDEAMTRVLHCLDVVTKEQNDTMVVLSELRFRRYLDNQVDPVSAAARALLPNVYDMGRPAPDGDIDVLIISKEYGLICGEVKSVGATGNACDCAIVKQVQKSLKQLEKGERVLKHLVWDLPPVTVTKVPMLPNVSAQQLRQAMATHQVAASELCRCVGVPDLETALSHCLLSDSLSPRGQHWKLSEATLKELRKWRCRALTRPVFMMTDSQYDDFLARFCGPATTIEVPTVTPPRRVIRTHAEAVAEAGLRWMALSLYPDQVDVLNRDDPIVYLCGPPGTGKTILLVLKAMEWLQKGNDVHIVATEVVNNVDSPIPYLIEKALQEAGQRQQLSSPTGVRGAVELHWFGSVDVAVRALVRSARGGELCLVTDEVFTLYRGREFTNLVSSLRAQVFSLRLWSAGTSALSNPPGGLTVHRLSTPLRCPPAVHREVEEEVTGDMAEWENILHDLLAMAPQEQEQWIQRHLASPKSGWSKDLAETPGDWSLQKREQTIESCVTGEEAVLRDFLAGDGSPQAVVQATERLTLATKYSPRSCPADTDGPPVLWLLHEGQAGHSPGRPEDCARCGEAVAEELDKLCVGRAGPEGMYYRDVFILFRSVANITDGATGSGGGKASAMVATLRSKGVPLVVVRPGDKDDMRDMALAVTDRVTVTDWVAVQGLERRVVVCVHSEVKRYTDGHRASSRCSSQLLYIR
ncbi:uncharacterized protein LOC143296440 isoform X2 [Babylonia areolata]|uniref:uncharacterized protein LOC143296440 isoform X2 n=1 Tax=Babylonia areolata TaxID=304850 RepID=UPI003FD31368